MKNCEILCQTDIYLIMFIPNNLRTSKGFELDACRKGIVSCRIQINSSIGKIEIMDYIYRNI